MDPAPKPVARGPRAYIPAIGSRLKVLLFVVFLTAALLGATGIYLGAISFLNWLRDPVLYTNAFTLWVVIVHVALGLVATVPFVAFGLIHLVTAWKRPNKVAVRLGVVVFIAGILVVLTGLALIQLEGFPQLPSRSIGRGIVYTLHLVVPVAAVWLYVRHRQAGPRIKWQYGYWWLGGTVAAVALMVGMYGVDPRQFTQVGPKEGVTYYFPSDARTHNGNFISAKTLMMDEYCKRCHADIYNDHFHSAHRFSSFNNPPYLFSVRETRKVALERDKNVKAARWCAGCHDPVPFFSGAFDHPDYDDVNDPTAHAGITCTVCHSITHINSTSGNAAYTIEEPQHYPFAFSDDPTLQWINNQLVKARPDFHKQTFLKPLHKSAEFCSTCHKVSLPVALNHYKDFLRGQNHYDSFLLSGVSGHGTRSFYYPKEPKTNCAGCHMPLKPSLDFGSRDFDGSGERKVHNHFFPGGNTGLPFLLTREDRYRDHEESFRKAVDENANFLRGTDPEGKDRKLRIDIFGLKKDASTEPDQLIAPLRPNLPKLEPGKTYLVEVVLRTLTVGHHFPQGTADSNEIWVDFQAKAGDRVIARNGAMADDKNDAGPVDEWAHFVNVLMLDRNGNRINRRNPQDIFTPLYDHQIPPGAAQVVHYRLDVPRDVTDPVEVRVRLRYRKFDHEYMQLVHKDREVPRLPVVDLCEDSVTLPVGNAAVPSAVSNIPEWQRWNDYGIGCLLEGPAGAKKGHYRQAEEAFRKMLTLGAKEAVAHARINLARVCIDEGRLNDAAKELQAAGQADPKPLWWSLAWFTVVVNSENASTPKEFDDVAKELRQLLDPATPPGGGFDFSRDYFARNKLANLLFKRSQFEESGTPEERGFLLEAVKEAERVLAEEPEDVDAHDLLKRCYTQLEGPPGPPAAETPDRDGLLPLALTVADANKPANERILAAAKLRAGVEQYAGEPMRPDQSKPAMWRELLGHLRPAFHAATAAPVQSAVAGCLAVLHRESHAAYKPDEHARAKATQIYRETHPAANYAARDRVIYPTTPAQREAILRQGNLP